MNPLLRALWNRLLPPGADAAVAVEPRPEPRRFGDVRPEPHDLSPCDLQLCWCWDEPEMAWILCHVDNLEPGDIWLPYSAIADPGARP